MPSSDPAVPEPSGRPQEAIRWDFVTPGLPDGLFEDAPGFAPTPIAAHSGS